MKISSLLKGASLIVGLSASVLIKDVSKETEEMRRERLQSELQIVREAVKNKEGKTVTQELHSEEDEDSESEEESQ
jgi:hypothetical protein